MSLSFANIVCQRINFDWSTNCWNWNRYRTEDGYGRMCWRGKFRLAHRVSKLLYGEMTWEQFENPHCVVMASVSSNPGFRWKRSGGGLKFNSVISFARRNANSWKRPSSYCFWTRAMSKVAMNLFPLFVVSGLSCHLSIPRLSVSALRAASPKPIIMLSASIPCKLWWSHILISEGLIPARRSFPRTHSHCHPLNSPSLDGNAGQN